MLRGTRTVAGEGTLESVARHELGGRLAAVLSAIALVVSGISLWETVLKQADLTVYVGDSLSYTLDPYGTYEVVAVPVTIANNGAQDSAVIKLTLDIKSLKSATSERFNGLYVADPRYFGEVDDLSTGKRRTKVPFAPLAIAGRGAYTGTILFYPEKPRDGSRNPLMEKTSKAELTLGISTPARTGWIDRVLAARQPGPVQMTVEVPNYSTGALLTGELARLRLAQ